MNGLNNHTRKFFVSNMYFKNYTKIFNDRIQIFTCLFEQRVANDPTFQSMSPYPHFLSQIMLFLIFCFWWTACCGSVLAFVQSIFIC